MRGLTALISIIGWDTNPTFPKSRVCSITTFTVLISLALIILPVAFPSTMKTHRYHAGQTQSTNWDII